jgi:hypothetical protein
MLEKVEKLQVIISSILFVCVLLIGIIIVASKLSQNVISVTGSAFEIVKSDSGSLEFEVNIKRPTKQAAYQVLQEKNKIVKKYLEDKKITDIEIKHPFGYYSYKIDPNTGNSTNIVDAYNMSQHVLIKANDVELIKEISTDISGLINEGVDINVFEPSYNYSKLPELKVQLLEKASIDAKNRANSMLKPTHNSAGKIQSVRMGVYQITPVESTNVSDEGINDTSSIDKKVTAVANLTFKIK